MDDNSKSWVDDAEPVDAKIPSSSLFFQNGSAEDKRLVEECLNGDECAWNQLVDKYKKLICSIPVKYGFSREDSADIFQNVCVTLFTNLSKVKKVESLRSWLVTVATHKCFYLMKHRKPDVELDALEREVAEALAPTPPMMLHEIEEEQKVRDAVRRLTPRCAELVKMLFFEQPPLAYADVAKKLGLATGSIGFIRGRCLERLQKILLELGL